MPSEKSLKRASEFVRIDRRETTMLVIFNVGVQSFHVVNEPLSEPGTEEHCRFIHRMFINALAVLLDQERAEGLDEGALICAAQGYPGLSHKLLEAKPKVET